MILSSIILSMFVSAPGDPYVQWDSARVELTTAQKSTLSSQVLSRSPGLVISELARLRCVKQNNRACCTPYIFSPKPGSEIRNILIAGETWNPGLEANTQLTTTPEFCVAGAALAQFATFIGNITTEASGTPILEAVFERTPGTSDVYLTTQYKKSMSAADCATYSDRVLIPMGIEP